MLLINKVDKKYDEEKEEEVKLEDPIKRWKRLLGNKDPAEAKAQEPDSLRAKYGVDAIKNGFYCSDDPKSANKERGRPRESENKTKPPALCTNRRIQVPDPRENTRVPLRAQQNYAREPAQVHLPAQPGALEHNGTPRRIRTIRTSKPS